MWPLAWLVALLLWCGGGSIAAGAGAGEWSPATLATLRGHAALQAEGLARCEGLTRAWLALADKETGLLPRNTKERAWVVKDSASDNYPYLVVSAYLTDRVLFGSTMLDILHAEAKYTSRVGRVRDDYSFEKHTWVREKLDMSKAVFGTAEYIKDGLLPLTDYLGPSPWSDEMLGMMDDLWAYANVKWPYGVIPSSDIEVHGDLLQALARLYWFTGNPKYIEYATRVGDYYMLGGHHLTHNNTWLQLRDHGCEVLAGLVELYVALQYTDPTKHEAYRKPIHDMLDRILEVGRNEHGMLYNVIDPKTGKTPGGKKRKFASQLSDTWGYTYNAYYTVYLLDNTTAYRDAVRFVLSNLPHYPRYNWEPPNDAQDGHADSIEGAITLYNREPVAAAKAWADEDIHVLWSKQRNGGLIEGIHADGNFARTTIMYCLWKSLGATVQPWRSDVGVGAVPGMDGEVLLLVVATQPWDGSLFFDVPRHSLYYHLPFDYPRINQFPECVRGHCRR
eukprot:TRINITY_DN846_c0_g1_i8.p1 TRINITY_DN846_c0_g1~~TRINITY_DN846_c0_g1_i8.p1  ORF type:complete len:505 (-),score=108.64 TRINITY_DN846_c0_g1_i8:383-1897(-)